MSFKKGYTPTLKHRENLRRANKGNHNFGDNKGKNNPTYGKHWKWDDKSKKKLSETMKENQNLIEALTGKKHSKKHNENIKLGLMGNQNAKGHIRTKKCKEKQRLFLIKYLQMHQGNFKDTDIEIIIEQRLRFLIRKNKISFYKKQVRFKRYLVDFYIPELNLIIECNGRFWHKGFAKKYKDMKRKQVLEKIGNKVLILWDDEIKSKNFNLTKILKERGLLNV